MNPVGTAFPFAEEVQLQLFCKPHSIKFILLPSTDWGDHLFNFEEFRSNQRFCQLVSSSVQVLTSLLSVAFLAQRDVLWVQIMALWSSAVRSPAVCQHPLHLYNVISFLYTCMVGHFGQNAKESNHRIWLMLQLWCLRMLLSCANA